MLFASNIIFWAIAISLRTSRKDILCSIFQYKLFLIANVNIRFKSLHLFLSLYDSTHKTFVYLNRLERFFLWLDSNNVQPRFSFAVPSCPDSSSGTLHCLIDLRQPIPKCSLCRGHIVISWMFTGVLTQTLLAIRVTSTKLQHFFCAYNILVARYKGDNLTRLIFRSWIRSTFSPDQQ